jgi:hypothetical protein
VIINAICSVPLFSDPSLVIDILTGQTADLIRFAIPEATFAVGPFTINIPIGPQTGVPIPLTVYLGITGGIEGTFQMKGGFDTSGILKVSPCLSV